MAEKLQKQMDEIRNNEREQRKMEKKLLQSQINPHFLYNTLDSIIWMIQSGEYKVADQMVSLLAKFFRISLSQGQDIISLKKELEHATSYLSIQNIRFKDKDVYKRQRERTLINRKALTFTAIFFMANFLWGNSSLIKNHSLLDNPLIPIQDLNTNFHLEPKDRKPEI